MQNMRKVLVGVQLQEDLTLSSPAREAVDKAFWLAEVGHAEVTLVYVVRDAPVETEAVIESGGAPSVDDVANSVLAELVKEGEERGIKVHSLLRHGRSWMEIIKLVITNEYDLVIVGSRGRGGALRSIFGGTDVNLLRKCPCPVWVTKPDESPNEVPIIVAADDFTAVGEEVLRQAVSTAQMMSARLLVVHVVSYPLEPSLKRTECSADTLKAYRDKVRAEAEAEANQRLAMTDARTLQQGVQVVFPSGRPETQIASIVQEHNADLLVMGTIARGGIPGFIIGNTAERLLAEVQCSLLAIKPDDFVSPIKV